MTTKNYDIRWRSVVDGVEHTERISSSDSGRALALFHSYMQIRDGLPRENYLLLSLKQEGFSEVPLPQVNPAVTDGFLEFMTEGERKALHSHAHGKPF